MLLKRVNIKCAVCGKRVRYDPTFAIGAEFFCDKGLVCYGCAPRLTREYMTVDGDNGRVHLFLGDAPNDQLYVTNSKKTLIFPVTRFKLGRHNLAGTRTDLWFNGPDGREWHGVVYGTHGPLRCRATKRLAAT